MASLNLCVYGSPHGYSSVPDAIGDYYKQFYRTNRRGRMLMAQPTHRRQHYIQLSCIRPYRE